MQEQVAGQATEAKARNLVTLMQETQANLDMGRENLDDLFRLIRGVLGDHEAKPDPPPQPMTLQSNQFIANAHNLMEDSAILRTEITKALTYFRENYGS